MAKENTGTGQEGIIRQVEALLDEGRDSDAIKLLKEHLKKNSGDVWAMSKLGQLDGLA